MRVAMWLLRIAAFCVIGRRPLESFDVGRGPNVQQARHVVRVRGPGLSRSSARGGHVMLLLLSIWSILFMKMVCSLKSASCCLLCGCCGGQR